MGLDISYYRSWKPYEGEIKDWDHAEEITMSQNIDLTHIWNNEEFKGRAPDMPEWVVAGEGGHFRAGSYGGYNQFRDHLCRALHGFPVTDLWKKPDEEMKEYAMWELLHFSDCEGVLDGACCARLHEQLEENWDKIVAFFGDDSWDLEKLGYWREAFEAAAGEGFVRFH